MTKTRFAVSIVTFPPLLAFAQGPDAGPPRRPVPPIMSALDANHDGVISREELANAAGALKTLDKNQDGERDETELRPNFGPGGGFGPMGDMRGQGGPGDERGSALSAEDETKRYMSLDKNDDGRLSTEEGPARMQGLFTRADADKDGVITKEEISAMVKKRFASKQNRGGGRGGFGGPPPD